MKSIIKAVVALAVNEGIENDIIEPIDLAIRRSVGDASEAEIAQKFRELFDRGVGCGHKWLADDAANLAQESFVEVLVRGIPFRDPAFDRTYFMFLQDKRIDSHRRGKVRTRREPQVQMEYENNGSGGTAATDNIGLNEIIRAAMDRLTAKQKQAVVLRFFEGRSEREIAHAIGQAEGTVRSHLHRAITILRKELVSIGIDSADA